MNLKKRWKEIKSDPILHQKHIECNRRYKEKNREKLRQKAREYYHKNVDIIKQKNKIYRKTLEYKQKQKERRKRHYQKNKEHEKRNMKKWYNENKERYNLIQEKHRTKKYNVIHMFILEDWKQKLLKTNGICPKCGIYVGIKNLTLDHNPPLNKVPNGFIYTIDNVSPLCLSCNCKKRDKIEEPINTKLMNFIKERRL